MRICINICGNDVLNWKVGCDDYLPDSRGMEAHYNAEPELGDIPPFGYQNLTADKKDTELGEGRERICVLPKNKYRHYHGVGSWLRNWTDTIAVTK